VAQPGFLIGDIGGTNARFALVDPTGSGFGQLREYKCRDFLSSSDAIRFYLDEVGAGRPERVCLAAAGPVVDDAVKVTNNDWIIAAADIRRELGVDSVRLINDFEAVACSIPFLGDRDVRSLGPHDVVRLPEGGLSVAVLGPGTGLGVAGLVRRRGILVPITGEGGHVGCAPETPLQTEIIEVLRKKFERVSAERLVAGAGVENIYAALLVINGVRSAPLEAPEIFARARNNSDDLAVQAVNVFFEMLGQMAGDLALTMSAADGVYIAGGIAKRYPDMLLQSGFRQAFESKGRHRHIMSRIPTLLITHDQPGLLGAAYLVRESD